MIKKLIMEFWIDENRENETEKILEGIMLKIKTGYYSSKDGKQIIRVDTKNI